MQNSFVDRFIYRRNGWIQKLLTLIFVGGGERCPQLLDLRPQIAAIASINGAAFFVLANALLG